MQEVSAAEALRPRERVAHTQALDLGDGYDEAQEREPRKTGQKEQQRQERERDVREDTGRERARGRAAADRRPGHDSDRTDVRKREDGRADDGGEVPVPAVQLRREDTRQPG